VRLLVVECAQDADTIDCHYNATGFFFIQAPRLFSEGAIVCTIALACGNMLLNTVLKYQHSSTAGGLHTTLRRITRALPFTAASITHVATER
jgi:hypothetical protein